MTDEPITFDELADSVTKIAEAFCKVGVTAQEALERISENLAPFFADLQKLHPEAFDEHGNLRDNWIEIVNSR